MPVQFPTDRNLVPRGANITSDGKGATFSCWAPRAQSVWVCGSFNGWTQSSGSLLNRQGDDWIGFLLEVRDNDTYKFYIEGDGTKGYKRDPYARELSYTPNYPLSDCTVRDPRTYPWHDAGYHPPGFNDLIIYQLHVGVFYGPDREQRPAKFLDVLNKIDYFVALGVNALQLLPIAEFASPRSRGYEGGDIFSPEMDYTVGDEQELRSYLRTANDLLFRKGGASLSLEDLRPQSHQLKALVDICHLYNIAVLFDVVYNHVGQQIEQQSESIYFFDRAAGTNPNDSLYFTDRSHAGGRVWAIWKEEVRTFLIDNALRLVREYHVDGFRYDQVSVIISENRNVGWSFCQKLTNEVRRERPATIQIAEYWEVNPLVVRFPPRGAGFDACWHDGLRLSIRSAIEEASSGSGRPLDMTRIASHLWAANFPESWRAVQYVESHDEVYKNRGKRVAALGDPGGARSWWGMSRARVATGLLLAAPGVPMLFMGQEFLEDKQWSDNPANDSGLLVWWDGLDGGIDREMTYHLQFVQAACRIRKEQPALRGERLNVVHVHDENRVLAFHRWIEAEGRDVMVIVSLNDSTQRAYEIGFPSAGSWREILNSEYHNVSNGSQVEALWQGVHGMPASARIVLPANSVLIFAR